MAVDYCGRQLAQRLEAGGKMNEGICEQRGCALWIEVKNLSEVVVGFNQIVTS